MGSNTIFFFCFKGVTYMCYKLVSDVFYIDISRFKRRCRPRVLIIEQV